MTCSICGAENAQIRYWSCPTRRRILACDKCHEQHKKEIFISVDKFIFSSNEKFYSEGFYDD